MDEREALGGGTVRYERSGHVAVVTLDRPDALNAVNADLARGAGDALARAGADPGVRAVVLTGAGRAFCAGADLRALAAGEPLGDPDHPERGFAGIVRHRVRVPVIAAVNGFALGGGTEIVLATDLAVIDEEATLGLPEVRRGLVAAAGGLLRLHHQVPQKVAAEMVFTGEPISARRAHDLGLVNEVAPAGASLERALDLARRIAANAPLAVAESKRLMHETSLAQRAWDDESWRLNDETIGRVFTSADAVEGPRAFAEKRAPRWTGR